MNNRIELNHSLKEYNKKYRNQYRLLKLTKKEVAQFAVTHHSKDKDYALKGRLWWLIDDTYYEVPRPFTYTWFRNLNNFVQVASSIGLVGVVASAIALPLALRPKPVTPTPTPEVKYNVTLDAKKVGYFDDFNQTKTIEVKKDSLLKDAVKDIKPTSYLGGDFNKYTFDGAGNDDLLDYKVTSDITIYAQYSYNTSEKSIFLYDNADDTTTAGKTVKLNYEGNEVTVDWGDSTQSNEGEYTHEYKDKGTYKITVSGKTSSIRFTTVSTETEESSLLKEGNKYIVGFILSNEVTEIPQEAFANMSNISEISIADNTKKIGDSAFSACSKLETVAIPNGVTTIGDSAFEDCDSLTNVVIGNNVSTIGDKAFSSLPNLENIVVSSNNNTFTSKNEETGEQVSAIINKGEKTLVVGSSNTVIPPTVTKIADNALNNNKKIEEIEIPSSVVEIGKNNFVNCDSLTTITVNENSEKFTSKDKDGNETNAIMAKTEDDGRELIVAVDGSNIPDEVTVIKPYALKGKTGMETFKWPTNLKKIGRDAFNNCSSLTTISIPKDVEVIGYDEEDTTKTYPETVFKGCSNVTSITVDSGNQYFTSYDDANVIATKDGNILRGCCYTDFTKLKSATAINEIAFEGVFGGFLGPKYTIDLSETSITSIGVGAFAFGTNISEFKFPAAITTINKDTFQGCANLNSVTMPTKYEIKERGFAHCFFLPSIDLTGATYIGEEAFSSCFKLNNVKFGPDLTYIGVKAFENCFSRYVEGEDPKITFATPNDGIKLDIYMKAFQNCYYLKEVVFPSSFNTCGKMIFLNCPNFEVCDLSNVDGLVLNNTEGIYPEGTVFGAYHAFEKCPNVKHCYVKASLVDTYKNDSKGWGVYAWLISAKASD